MLIRRRQALARQEAECKSIRAWIGGGFSVAPAFPLVRAILLAASRESWYGKRG